MLSPPNTTSSPLVASETYVEHYRDAMNQQRQAFNSERALWEVERTELLEKIAALEESLCRHQGFPRDARSTSADTLKHGSTRFGNPYTGNKITPTSGIPGCEFWRGAGGKIGTQPTRTFSESSTCKHSGQDRLPVIAENVSPIKARRTLSESIEQSTSIHKPSIPSLDTHKNYDGINFKSVATSTTNSSECSSVQPGACTDPLSSPRETSRRLQLPSVGDILDNLTKDAGHTPLARTTYGLDGTTSVIDSDLPTPIQPEQERPPFEPHSSFLKRPAERSDSYFPPPADEGDQDPELREPLSLRNDGSNNTEFLSKLDSKLLRAAQSSTPPTAVSASEVSNDAYATEIEGFVQPEQEPKLRIKRSMNFGSQLGGRFPQ
ncbi:MAG: hypothetical protein Q9201_005363 [Fulgogasparrea decipioides]